MKYLMLMGIFALSVVGCSTAQKSALIGDLDGPMSIAIGKADSCSNPSALVPWIDAKACSVGFCVLPPEPSPSPSSPAAAQIAAFKSNAGPVSTLCSVIAPTLLGVLFPLGQAALDLPPAAGCTGNVAQSIAEQGAMFLCAMIPAAQVKDVLKPLNK